ncbi:DUF2336 domain-containing protein [Pyruvatibacter mobilis]|uniref:DUF2336 domain-containing protein n=1 Tax=Pyruvatibacter mobilis TaxID=1712261 RepID=UPI003C7C2588
MAPQLTQSDITELLTAPTPDKRAQIARKVGRQIDAGGLSGQERLLANDILRLMVRDAAEMVRTAVAESLCAASEVPADVVNSIISDIDSVAVPFIERSPLITDEALLEIIEAGAPAKVLAIASRGSVSEEVSDAIARDGERNAVVRLLGNEGATLSTSAFSEVLTRWHDDVGIADRMAMRKALPLTVVERLVSVVSDEMKNRLVARGGVGNDIAERLAFEARESVTIKLFDGLDSIEDFALLMSHLQGAGRLSGTLIVRAACLGEMKFVEHALAQLARISPERAWTLVHDAGRLGLRALFQQARLSQDLYLPLRIAVDVYHEMVRSEEVLDREHFRRQIIERILTQPDGLKNDDLDFLLYQIARQEQIIAQREGEAADAVRAASA